MGDVGFIRGRWVDAGAPLGLMGSSCVVGFTRVRAAGLCVHPGWLGSLGCTLEVAGFIRGCWVHSCTPWVSLGSSVVALGYALAVVGLIRVVVYTRERPGVVESIWGRWGHSDAPWGSLRSCVIVGFIRGRWVHSGAPLGSLGSSEVVGFNWVCLGDL